MTIICLWTIALFNLTNNLLASSDSNELQKEQQEYQQEMKRIQSLIEPIQKRSNNDINSYEEFVNEIQKKWKVKNPEYYARLMNEICIPLNSGTFYSEKRYSLARKYALSALSEPNKIFIETELDLTGQLATSMVHWYSPTDSNWPAIRKNDTELRLHAWKRLTDTIDPNYDKAAGTKGFLEIRSISPPEGLPMGADPNLVKDKKLRQRYQEELDEYYKKINWRNQQYRFRQDLKWFSKQNEQYIEHLYSIPPYNNEELQNYLDRHIANKETKDRIMTAVRTNIAKAEKEKAK